MVPMTTFDRRHVGAQGFERRESETLVVGEKRKRGCPFVQPGELPVRDVVMNFDPLGEPGLRGERRQVDPRPGPVVANNRQPHLRMRARQEGESGD